MKDKKFILIFDRGYPSLEFIYYLNKLGVKYLFRIRNISYANEKKNMITKDELVDLKITSGRLQHITDETLKLEIKKHKKIDNIRITKITLNDGTIEELLSNLNIDEILYEEMKKLYYKRWNIEISYDILKNKLYIENFSGKLKITIEQDFYAQILLYNMLEDLKKDAGKVSDSKTNLKYEYKINMNCLVGLFKMKIIEIAVESDDKQREKLYLTLLTKIKRYLVRVCK